MQASLEATIKEQQHDDGEDKSVSSLEDNEIFNRGEDDLPMPPVKRVVSDSQYNLRSSLNSTHSAWSESSARTKQRKGGAVNRLNNGVLASTNPISKRRSSANSSLSASDSNIRFSMGSLEQLSRSITLSNSNQNQEQQQQHEPPTNYNDEIHDNSNQVDRHNGHKDNNVDETQIQPKQSKSFCTRCCNGWQYVLACAPMKRYRKRSSGITTLENQYFIPPPEENTTFIESIIYTMNGYGQDFVVWIYQSSFFAVLTICLMAYYALVFAFAGIALALERSSDGRCNFVTETLMSSGSMFEFAFELSWTTFTTVGYGQVAPSGEDCYPLRIGCSFFAFMGLLFNSLSAAIFFSKLERVLTKASVTFSSSVCLQFDTAGADRFARMNNSWKMGVSLRSVQGETVAYPFFSRPVQGEAVPYPFLEFRIVNDHGNQKSRGVRNASCAALVSLSGKHAELISCEAQQSSEVYKEFVTKSFSIDDDLDHELQNTTTGKSLPKSASKSTPSFYSAAKAVMKANAAMKANASPRKARRSIDRNESGEPLPSQEERPDASVENIDPARKARPSARTRRHQMGIIGLTDSIKQTAIVVQENDNGKGQQVTPEGRIFFPLELEPSENPYMNRVWYLRHTLNAKSPLLRYSIREKLKRDGVWDAELNTYQDIMASLVDFHKISVTFRGTSAASNHLLFQQKVCKCLFLFDRLSSH